MIGIIFTFLMGLFMSLSPICDNDVFWHWIVGKWIDTNKAIPSKELFSWFGTKMDYDWVSHEWLSEWIMYKIGPVGNIVLMMLIFIGLYFLMFKMLKLNIKKLFDFKWLYLLLMTVFFRVTGPRPYIISLLFFAYLIYVLFNYLDDAKPIFKKLIWTLPLVQILWVNLHGGSSSLPYVYLIGILLSDFVLKLIPNRTKRWGEYSLSNEQRKTLLLLLIAIIGTSLINPATYQILLYPFTNMTDTSMLENILEWESPSFHGLLGMYVFIMIAVPLFNMMFTEKKYKFYEIAIFALMLFMCLKSQRFVGMFGIYATWMLGKYFFVTDEMYEGFRKPFKKFEKVITFGFCGILILILALVGYKKITSFDKIIDNDGYYSDESIKTVIALKPERLYNDYGQGGYLLYKLDEFGALGDIKVFAYGLGDVFSDDVLPDAAALSSMKKNTDFNAILEKYDFDVIITAKMYPLHYYLDARCDWELVQSDDYSYVYVKNDVCNYANE